MRVRKGAPGGKRFTDACFGPVTFTDITQAGYYTARTVSLNGGLTNRHSRRFGARLAGSEPGLANRVPVKRWAPAAPTGILSRGDVAVDGPKVARRRDDNAQVPTGMQVFDTTVVQQQRDAQSVQHPAGGHPKQDLPGHPPH